MAGAKISHARCSTPGNSALPTRVAGNGWNFRLPFRKISSRQGAQCRRSIRQGIRQKQEARPGHRTKKGRPKQFPNLQSPTLDYTLPPLSTSSMPQFEQALALVQDALTQIQENASGPLPLA